MLHAGSITCASHPVVSFPDFTHHCVKSVVWQILDSAEVSSYRLPSDRDLGFSTVLIGWSLAHLDQLSSLSPRACGNNFTHHGYPGLPRDLE